MANPLRRAAVRRKWLYFGLILALFTVSIFWRGKLAVPFANQVRPSAWLADRAVLAQAKRLDLRELDQGDPEIAGSAARLSLVGSRGVVITALWRAAIEKQKRNEWHEFEVLVRTVTRLQPNFITPWLFQSWNIAYNVSVENDKLGDMYFYIARGIELLAEGERLNTKTYVEPDGTERKVGSPDIRYQIGFYYSNKFGVSDKVNTLRSLMQVSCIRPADRAADSFKDSRTGGLDRAAFLKFCEKNPQLVRRLRTKLNCARPEEVVQFLKDNDRVPSLFKNDTELADAENQFPILPPPFPAGSDEYTASPTGAISRPMDDTFDAFLAARAWSSYSLTVIPPPRKDEYGDPVPWAAPRPDEYDPFRYRMPRAPALIIFRQQAPRVQTSLAERLQKEGWFDETSRWNPDERAGAGAAWFARPGEREVELASRDNSKVEWAKAWEMWDRHGRENALVLTPEKRAQLEDAAEVHGTPIGLPPDMTDDELEARGLTRRKVNALKALVYYDQNRSVTNFPFFLESSRAEKEPITVEARKLLWQAEQARQNAEYIEAVRLYTEALAKWRQVLLTFPQFHRPERSDRTEEETYEFEVNLIQLLREDGGVRARAARSLEAATALFPWMATPPGAPRQGDPLAAVEFKQAAQDFLQATAEDEAMARVTAETVTQVLPKLPNPSDPERQVVARVDERAAKTTAGLAGLVGGPAEATPPAALKAAVARAVVDTDFAWMKEFKYQPIDLDSTGKPPRQAYWVSPDVRESVRSRLGLVRRVMTPPNPGDVQLHTAPAPTSPSTPPTGESSPGK